MTSPSNEPYVIIHRTYDPVQADMLGDLLRENGIFARVLGTRHGSVIGVAQIALQMHIEVPRSQAGEATDFVEAFFDGQGEELLREHEGLAVTDDDADADGKAWVSDDEASDGTGPATGTDRAGPELEHLRPLFAAGASLLFGMFGGAHLYCRRYYTAGLLFGGHVIAFVNILGLGPTSSQLSALARWQSFLLGAFMMLVLVLLDLIAGQRVVRQARRGVHNSEWRQLFAGAAFVAVAGSVGSLLAPHVPLPRDVEPTPATYYEPYSNRSE